MYKTITITSIYGFAFTVGMTIDKVQSWKAVVAVVAVVVIVFANTIHTRLNILEKKEQ